MPSFGWHSLIIKKIMNCNHFDIEAKLWDIDPQRQKRAEIFAREINELVNPHPRLNALEFGCGTGLLSFHLKERFKTITLADNSKGMIEVLNNKIRKECVDNFFPQHIDLMSNSKSKIKYDIVYSLMALHHIQNLESAFNRFKSMVLKNGYLCIGDLVKEDGSFHESYINFNGHNGFDKDEISLLLLKHDFEPVFYKICYEQKKQIGRRVRKFPIFLIVARKR